jgi:hypothetical protein
MQLIQRRFNCGQEIRGLYQAQLYEISITVENRCDAEVSEAAIRRTHAVALPKQRNRNNWQQITEDKLDRTHVVPVP